MHTERQNHILAYLAEVSFSKVEQLSDTFGVSIETIRRDLLDLEKDGSITRVRGGASYNAPRAREIALAKKKENHQAEKLAIVRAAVGFVNDDDALILPNGSINIFLAKKLADTKRNLTVVTNSFEIAACLCENTTNKVMVTGGMMRPINKSLVGSMCLEALDRFRADKAIINADGIHMDLGIMECNLDESAVLRKALLMSHKKIVLAEYCTFNEVAMNKIVTADTIDMIITDWNIPGKVEKEWEDFGVRIISGKN